MATPSEKIMSSYPTVTVEPFDGCTVEIVPDPKHAFLVSNQQLAQAFGVSDSTLRMHAKRHQDELTEGKHFFLGVTNSDARSNLPIRRKMWTKAGIIRMGMFVKSDRARRFRDWAEKVILEHLENGTVRAKPVSLGGLPKGVKTTHNRLTPQRLLELMEDIVCIKDDELRMRITDKLLGKNVKH